MMGGRDRTRPEHAPDGVAAGDGNIGRAATQGHGGDAWTHRARPGGGSGGVEVNRASIVVSVHRAGQDA